MIRATSHVTRVGKSISSTRIRLVPARQQRTRTTAHSRSPFEDAPSRITKRRLTTTKQESPSSRSKPETKNTHQQAHSNSNSSSSTGPLKDELYFYGTLMYRLTVAYGGIYCLSEYGFQLTNCNGPSMLPTMNPIGEIIFIDRLTPRLYGLGTSSSATECVRQARERQLQHECKYAGNDDDNRDEEWHEPFIPCNEMPQAGKWQRFWKNLRTGISRGDVVVVEHPRREGTVCKRVLGLPGDDIIVKKSQYNASHFRHGSEKASRAARKSLHTVPDGHVWLEGDNSANSLDSRSYGTVPAAMIVGRVPFRVWPLRGNAMMERGMRPSSKRQGEPKWGSQGSTVLPAGYRGERIVKTFRSKDVGGQ